MTGLSTKSVLELPEVATRRPGVARFHVPAPQVAPAAVSVSPSTRNAPTGVTVGRRTGGFSALRPDRTISPRRWAVALLAGFMTVVAIQPSRDARPPTQPAWADALAVGALLLLLVAFVALLSGRRWGFGAATYGSAGFVLVSMLCPAWDHHQVGWWWIGQSVISVAMLAGSVIQRSRVAGADARAETARWVHETDRVTASKES